MNIANKLSNWAVEIQDINELDESFNNLLIQKFHGKNPYSILLSNDILITFALDQLYLFSKINDEVFSKSYNYNKINLIEIDLFSNDSKLIITSDKNEKISINPANELLFFRGIEKIRLLNCREINDDKFSKIDYLKIVDKKLYNYALFSLLKCEKIIDSIYQSNNSNTSGSNITILSTNELIFIEESTGDNNPNESVFGGKWIFIPLTKIKKIERLTNDQSTDLKITFKNEKNYLIHYNNKKTDFDTFDKNLKNQIDA